MSFPSVIPFFISLIFCSPLFSQSRGVWFWQTTTLPTEVDSPWGSSQVVGNSAKENNTIVFLKARHIDRIYGSYGNRPRDEASVIARWNCKLHNHGISSQLLLDGGKVNDAAWMSDLLIKIDERLIDFNALRTDTRERFKALHLDLEPQTLTIWKDDKDDPATTADDLTYGSTRRALLNDLLQAYQTIRNHLDTNDLATMPIYVDIGFTWDKLPTSLDPSDDGSVRWASVADRHNWFSDVANTVDGVSVMSFSKTTSISIQDATEYERTGPMAGKVTVSMQPRTGPGELWANHTSFTNVMVQLEGDIPGEATDIENYAFLRHCSLGIAYPGDAAVFSVGPSPDISGNGLITIKTKPDHQYALYHADTPGRWQLLRDFGWVSTTCPAHQIHEVKLIKSSGFYRVSETSRR